MTTQTSIYIHIPFCKHRCAYCDFNTYANQESLIPEYVQALINEIDFVGNANIKKQLSTNIHTVFFGGGTPSLLSVPQFDSIMRALTSTFTLTADAEVTIEANPGKVSMEKLNGIRKAGINRISFGVQSSIKEELRMLEREHDFFDVIEAVSNARKSGFDNLNLDLIYGLPEQTLGSWQTTLKRVVELNPEHVSAYALTLEHGTPFGKWSAKGLLPLPDPDLAADMYEWASEYLGISGYTQYEISNWASNKHEGGRIKDETLECKHNLQYWRSLPYYGLGAGAHGYIDGIRYSNALRIKTYIERLANYGPFDHARGKSSITNHDVPFSPATVNHKKQSLKENMSDYMLNNLRLVNAGVDQADFRLRFGCGLFEAYPAQMADLIQKGLIEVVDETSSKRIRLTQRGRLLGNKVFIQFVE